MATAGKILMFPVGNWTSGNNYGFLDIVYYGGSSYIAKTDIANSTVNPEIDITNWQILARGYLADTLSGINGIDTSGLIGAAGETVSSQTLIDKIADMVADKLILKTSISNQQVNDTNKVTGSALTYQMNQAINALNSNLAMKANASDLANTNSNLALKVNLDTIKTKSYDTFPTIWDRTDYPRSIYNWKNDSNFPANYGSGYILPTADTSYSYIIYMAASRLWAGKLYHGEARIEWSEK